MLFNLCIAYFFHSSGLAIASTSLTVSAVCGDQALPCDHRKAFQGPMHGRVWG